MPNHIKNRIKFIGDDNRIKELVERYSTFHESEPRKSYDGNLIYMKDGDVGWWDEEKGIFSQRDKEGVHDIPEGFIQDFIPEYTSMPDFKKVIPPPNNDAYNDLPNQREAEKSPNWWYTWNIENWGTKWNGYSNVKFSDNEYEFQTAWNPASKIVEEIHENFPDVRIDFTYADEDSGYKCGKVIFENGIMYANVPNGGSKEAYEIYFELNPEDRENYELIDGNYEYKED